MTLPAAWAIAQGVFESVGNLLKSFPTEAAAIALYAGKADLALVAWPRRFGCVESDTQLPIFSR
jgi:hypothetical protein